jgi:hypothetical protein
MADWLRRVIDEVDRQFEELPEWKRTSTEQFLSFSQTENEHSSTIREPQSREREFRVIS